MNCWDELSDSCTPERGAESATSTWVSSAQPADRLPPHRRRVRDLRPGCQCHDFKRYPQMWITAKFMHGLLLFVFAYFWAHSLLWW